MSLRTIVNNYKYDQDVNLYQICIYFEGENNQEEDEDDRCKNFVNIKMEESEYAEKACYIIQIQNLSSLIESQKR